MIASGVFSPDDPHRYRPLIQALTDGGDPFLVTADFQAYREAHEAVGGSLPQPGSVDAEGCHQHRVDGLVLQRPDHRRICEGNLERRACSAGGLRTVPFPVVKAGCGAGGSTPRFHDQNTKAVC